MIRFQRSRSRSIISKQGGSRWCSLSWLLGHCVNVYHIKQAHAFMVRSGLDEDNPSLTRFIRVASSLGFPLYAYSVFSHAARSPDTYLYNTIISSLLLFPVPSIGSSSHHHHHPPSDILHENMTTDEEENFGFVIETLAPQHPPSSFSLTSISSGSSSSSRPHRDEQRQTLTAQLALSLYTTMQIMWGLRPDTYSIPLALKAATTLSAFDTGKQIHSQSISLGLLSHLHVLTALLLMYSSSSSSSHLSDARKLFDESPAKDVALWNALLSGYAKSGDVEEARALFDAMPLRNVVSWTAVIGGYAHFGKPHEALQLFWRMMQAADGGCDEVALLGALSACAHLGALQAGRWIHNFANTRGFRDSIPLNNAIIDMYAKSGDIESAFLVFNGMQRKTIVTWTTMIAGLALHGLANHALHLFSRMESAGVKPNAVTLLALLSACSHAGLVEVGRSIFNYMRSGHGVEPTIEHYGCMIDLLGRAGLLKEAVHLVGLMPFETNAAIWGSLLASSNIYGDAELGERALRHLMHLEPRNSGNYALLCNTYTSLGRRSESRMLRKLMRDAGIKKIPGGSSIELNSRVHEFISGDMSHPQFETMCQLLCIINWHLNVACHSQEERGKVLTFFDA